MPFMLPAAAASTAIGTGAALGASAGAAGTALGTGIAAGTALAGGAGLAGLVGGMGALGGAGTAGSVLGALAPGAASAIAPAAASQLAGTIATPGLAGTLGGSVAPGAFGANLAGATSGLTSTLPGVTSTLPGVTSTLPGVYNPATAETLAAKFLANSPYPVANASNLNFLNSATAGLQGSGGPLQMYSGMNSPAFLNTTLQGSALPGVTSNLPAASLGNAVTGPAIPNVTSQLATAPATSQIIPPTSAVQTGANWMQNLGNLASNPSWQGVKDYASEHPYATTGIAALAGQGVKKLFEQKGVEKPEDNAMIRPYTYERTQRPDAYAVSPTQDSSERLYFNDQFVAGEPYKAAGGGIVSLAIGGPVEQMANMNSVGMNTGYPMANLQTPVYSNPDRQRPEATNIIAPSADVGINAYTGEQRFSNGGPAFMGPTGSGYYGSGSYSEGARLPGSQAPRPGGSTPNTPLPKYTFNPSTQQFTQTVGGNKVSGGITAPAMPPTQMQRAAPFSVPAYQSPEQQLGLSSFYDMMSQQLGGFGDYAGYAAGGGIGGASHLGDYSDGGRLLKGPGDGVSDSIPASIGDRQPARLADGEFVVPARIVSELGNGSTEAGARKLYAMMDRVQNARKKSVGKKNVAVNSKADKYLPA